MHNNSRIQLQIVTILIIIKISMILIFCSLQVDEKPVHRVYSFDGDDFPQLLPLPQTDPVLMAFEDSVHYQMNTEDGRAEWASLTPGSGLVYLGEQHHPFSISMFHQLRCLDILREDLVGANGNADLSRHCLNYLRQMVMCRGDTQLENILIASKEHPSQDFFVRTGSYVCSNWNSVLEEVKKNQAAAAKVAG
ncbi:hypothetical protein DEU56DRAFT_39827 [Suillus clintonianus]|uniref:uncharacterized protein n=1 Tax=Suillus clintonianus TaxID=1904413 RepID=UPI001B8844C6|nr:uncharacterized protein DEU56DRAFT_39827 [Suillus clintonianus]KAG2124199.1 hypothetical protein DEU56DRAFT_39827 [Suillus clintonianus]